MTSPVIGAAEAVTPAWLTRALRRRGAITSGVVALPTIEPAGGDNSQAFRIRVGYSAGATGDLPQRLWLKTCAGGVFGPSEVPFSTRDYAAAPGAPRIRVYDAAYDESRGAYHILLDDVSLTHCCNHGRIPTPGYAAALGRAFAALHAPYWHDTQREAIGAAVPDAAAIRRALEPAEPGLEPMLVAAGNAAAAEWGDALHDVWRRYPALLAERTQNAVGFTVVHGDPNPGNILSPLYVASEWCVDERDRARLRWVWLPQLHRSLAAFRDLRCGELMGIDLP